MLHSMKRLSVLIVATACCSAPLAAGTSISFGSGASAAWYQAHVEDDGDLPFRSAAEVTLSPALGLKFGNNGLYAYVPVSYISPSMEFNDKQLKPCLELGFGMRGEWFFTDVFGAMLSASINQGWYMSADEGKFASFTLGTGPLFLRQLGPSDRLVFSVPVGLDIRDDVFAPTLGVRVAYYHDVRLR